jgi:hypothetical protein
MNGNKFKLHQIIQDLFSNYLVSVHYMSSTMSGAGGTHVNKKIMIILWGDVFKK